MARAPGPLDEARKELYAAIVAQARDSLARYYSEWPERLDNERSKDALEWSMRGIGRVLRLLDGYDITPRTKTPRHETPVKTGEP